MDRLQLPRRRRLRAPRATVAMAIVLMLLAVGCTSDPPSPTGSSGEPPSSASSDGPVSPSVRPRGLPADLPESFDQDIPAEELNGGDLVPPGTEPGPVQAARVDGGEAAVVTWTLPSGDPLRAERGLVVWRRAPGAEPPWRPVFGRAIPEEDMAVGLDMLITDLTGDGSDDALVTEIIGGNGTCGVWTVVDLASGKQRYRREGCDQRVDPAPGKPGLLVTEAVYGPSDPHCCPSATRLTVLRYRGGTRWKVVSRSMTETG